jgi:hypothetical protein
MSKCLPRGLSSLKSLLQRNWPKPRALSSDSGRNQQRRKTGDGDTTNLWTTNLSTAPVVCAKSSGDCDSSCPTMSKHWSSQSPKNPQEPLHQSKARRSCQTTRDPTSFWRRWTAKNSRRRPLRVRRIAELGRTLDGTTVALANSGSVLLSSVPRQRLCLSFSICQDLVLQVSCERQLEYIHTTFKSWTPSRLWTIPAV